MTRANTNHLGQPVGVAVPDWSERPRPPQTAMHGRFCRVVPLDPEQHVEALYFANCEDADGRMWTYLPFGPFPSLADYRLAMATWLDQGEWLVHAIIDERSGLATGSASYMRIDPPNGSIEVGAIMYSPRLQRTAAATEAMYLMMHRVFDELGYRRYEWKCNALNEPSIKAATRLGFQYEGTFRQSNVVKGRNRDTAWFSVIDREWPRLKVAFESWLSPDNFEADGRQRTSLRALVTSSRSAPESR